MDRQEVVVVWAQECGRLKGLFYKDCGERGGGVISITYCVTGGSTFGHLQ